MNTEREMTLKEWMGKLAPSHGANRELKLLEERIAELEKGELETVTKARKMFVCHARRFGFSNSVGHTIQELQKWEQELKKEQGDERKS